MTLSRLAFGLWLLLFAFTASGALAQELDCRVSVDYSNLSGSDYDFLDELDWRIEEYLNDHSWTDDRFLPQERIDCDVQLYFQEAVSMTEFEAQLVVASRRPIYGTVQATPVVRFNDTNLRFSYTQGQPLTHDLEQYNPLTSVLDFYAFLLLGYDYDTFEELGGTSHFAQARRIAERAQSAGAGGWTEVGNRGRRGLVTQLLDSRFQPLRQAYFRYHLEGLDRFVEDAEAARAEILDVLDMLEELYESVSRQYVMDVFFTAKSSELTAVFMDSRLSDAAYQRLNRLDPSNDYSRLVE